jgi:predicted Co/Zn/Cd cation transporter (cation efflux family)
MFNMVLVILQLWLFVAALENLLAGRHGVAIPAAIVSVVCLAVNWWMLVGVYRVERT